MKKISCVVLVVILLAPAFFTGDLTRGEKDEFKSSGSEEYEGGYRYNIQGWIYLHIEGDPYERGYQHGYLLADEIVDMIQRWSNIFPRKWSWKVQKLSARRLFWNKYPEEYKQEIKGIADGVAARGGMIDGSSVDYKDILTLNEMYELLSRFRTYYIHPFRTGMRLLFSGFFKSTSYEHIGKCSAFIATGDATSDGGIVASHSTFAYEVDGTWFHPYIAERWNVILDVQPIKGYRILMSTSPGLIWSDEDFYQNSAGMILMETTLHLGTWTRRGDPVVVRARKAIQYSDSIDEIVDCFLEKNNGLMANNWVIGDTKTGEIASLELALHNYGLRRTKNGFIWSCNNAKDDRVRWELNSVFGFGLIGRLLRRDFKPSNRDIKFEELRDEYYGEIDVDVAKRIMSTQPICSRSIDCKITDSQLVNDFGLWCFMGKPDGSDFIADEYPFKKPRPGYTDIPACGWVQLYALSHPNNHQSANQKLYHERETGKLLWEYETMEGVFGNAVYSSPTIAGDTLYATSWNGDITAVDVNSGKKRWEENIGWSSTSSPVVVDKTVYVGSSDGLHALNKNSGRIIWSRGIGAVSSKPAFSNGVVYCGCHDGGIYAFDSENGGIEWVYMTNGEIYSSPSVKDNVLYIGSNDKHLYAIDVETGKTRWIYKTGGAVCSSPMVYRDRIYFGSWDNNFYALDVETGKLKWKFTTGWGIDSSPTVRNGVIYFGSEDNNLYALDADDGTLKWVFKANAGIHSSPAVYGGFVFFGCGDGKIYAVNASNGDLVWSIAPDYYIEGVYSYVTKPILSSPAVYDGMVFIGSTNGRMYCFDAGTFESPAAVLEEIQVPVDTWLFLVIPLICVILATMFYLHIDRKRVK